MIGDDVFVTDDNILTIGEDKFKISEELKFQKLITQHYGSRCCVYFFISSKEGYRNRFYVNIEIKNNEEPLHSCCLGIPPIEYSYIDGQELAEKIEDDFKNWKDNNKHLITPLGKLLNEE